MWLYVCDDCGHKFNTRDGDKEPTQCTGCHSKNIRANIPQPQADNPFEDEPPIDNPPQEIQEPMPEPEPTPPPVLALNPEDAQRLDDAISRLTGVVNDLSQNLDVVVSQTATADKLADTAVSMTAKADFLATTATSIATILDKKQKEIAEFALKEAAFKDIQDKFYASIQGYKSIEYYKAIEKCWQYVPENTARAIINRYFKGIEPYMAYKEFRRRDGVIAVAKSVIPYVCPR